MTVIGFDCVGRPVAQGSKRLFTVNGKARSAEMGVGHGAWRNDLAEAAFKAMGLYEQDGVTFPLTGPLELSCIFRFPMPASRRKRDKQLGCIPKVTAPDLDKLVRTVGDSLQAAGLIRDDSLVARLEASKVEVLDSWIGCSIRVRCLNA